MYHRHLQGLECAEQAEEVWFRLESLAVCICQCLYSVLAYRGIAYGWEQRNRCSY